MIKLIAENSGEYILGRSPITITVIAMMPYSNLLRKCPGKNELHKSQEKIIHQIKLFGEKWKKN